MKWFSYEKIFLASRGDCSTILKLFKQETSGINWILNEDIVIKNPLRLSKQELAEYLGLCALRNYSDLTLYNNKDLDLNMIPLWIPDVVIKTNPLVTTNKTHLIFKFEEIK